MQTGWEERLKELAQFSFIKPPAAHCCKCENVPKATLEEVSRGFYFRFNTADKVSFKSMRFNWLFTPLLETNAKGHQQPLRKCLQKAVQAPTSS